MATSYSFITSGVANAVVASTRVKVVANNACFLHWAQQDWPAPLPTLVL